MSSSDGKKELIKEIVDEEYRMFKSLFIKNSDRCKDNPKTFKLVRWAYFSVLSNETLQSYLNDLKEARKHGRNLLEEKYARMDELIPQIKENPLIDEIVTIRLNWMKELASKYPHVFEMNEKSFANYLRSELETYSDRTLELIYKDLKEALKRGRNLLKDQYEYIFSKIGYNSLEEVERKKAR